MKKQDLKANLIISGPIFPEPVQVMMTHDMGNLVKVIGKGLRTDKFYDPILDSDQLDSITASPEKEPFDGDPARFRLGIEGMRSDRLRRLETAGIITAEPEKKDGRRVNYRLTEKGIDLAPVLLELLVWGARHEETSAPCVFIDKMETHREQFLAEVRRRRRERDLTPLLPAFKVRKEKK